MLSGSCQLGQFLRPPDPTDLDGTVGKLVRPLVRILLGLEELPVQSIFLAIPFLIIMK